MSKTKSKYASIGSLILQSAFDNDGNRLVGEYKTDENGKKMYAIKLDKKTKIVIDGVDMTGKTLYVARPEVRLTRLANSGYISKDELEEKLGEYSSGGRLEFIQMEITANLDK